MHTERVGLFSHYQEYKPVSTTVREAWKRNSKSQVRSPLLQFSPLFVELLTIALAIERPK
jgi:hypothetical protein